MAEADRQRWNAKYAARSHARGEPSPALVGLRAWLAPPGRALDLAGGAGANALYLATLGFDVTLVDIAERGLEIASERAAAAGLRLRVIRADLERDPLPAGPWDLITCSHYLQRELIATAADALAPDGRLIWIHPTTTNLERHAKPSARFLLAPGEAEALVRDAGLAVQVADEGWVGADDGSGPRHLARLVAARETAT